MSQPGVVLVAYLAALGLIAVFGVHKVHLVAALRRPAPPAPRPPADWPSVTVQLPLYNERYVAERLIRAVGALDYPRDRLEVQVLDDSTDDTTDIARRVVGELRGQGVDAALLHRDDRAGFKAGALAAGLAVAKGELVAIFDADFVPPPDFLRRTVPYVEEGVGLVQARWGHLNAGESWLTRAQATLLDAHFLVEHAARARLGRWFNFNGTAGVWRKRAITDAGGWSDDTLTEDLDLSYRAQLAGWRFVFVGDVVAPAELPSSLAAFRSQQHRWAKGAVQTARKLLGPIWRSRAPLPVRLEATLHLVANVGWPLSLLIAALLPLAVAARGREGWSPWLLVDTAMFAAATGSALLFYGAAIRAAGHDVGRRLLGLPIVLALGVGLAAAQTRAVADGLSGRVGRFVRTPKRGDGAGYRARVRGLPIAELALAVWLCGATIVATAHGYLASVPFLALFAAGYTAVGLRTLREALR